MTQVAWRLGLGAGWTWHGTTIVQIPQRRPEVLPAIDHLLEFFVVERRLVAADHSAYQLDPAAFGQQTFSYKRLDSARRVTKANLVGGSACLDTNVNSFFTRDRRRNAVNPRCSTTLSVGKHDCRMSRLVAGTGSVIVRSVDDLGHGSGFR
jgi:hypothetical protein